MSCSQAGLSTPHNDSKYRSPVEGSVSEFVLCSSRFQRASNYPIHTSRATRQTPEHTLCSSLNSYSMNSLFVEESCTTPASRCCLSSSSNSCSWSDSKISGVLSLYSLLSFVCIVQIAVLFRQGAKQIFLWGPIASTCDLITRDERRIVSRKDSKIVAFDLFARVAGGKESHDQTLNGGSGNHLSAHLWALWLEHTRTAKCSPHSMNQVISRRNLTYAKLMKR